MGGTIGAMKSAGLATLLLLALLSVYLFVFQSVSFSFLFLLGHLGFLSAAPGRLRRGAEPTGQRVQVGAEAANVLQELAAQLVGRGR